MVLYQVLRGFKNFIKNIKAPRVVIPVSIIRYNLLISYYKEKSSFILSKLTFNSFSNNG
jgi:tRNA(Ser,Leu) C12 N-acetylase TAN1